mgnify:CR=1 FL=1
MPEEVIYHVEHHAETTFGFKRDYEQVQLPRNGLGYFAGSFPDGLTTIKGVPVSAEVRVLLRTPIQGYGDGVVVASTQSAPDGTWRVEGLHTHLKYDVVARYFGERDTIASDVTPELM